MTLPTSGPLLLGTATGGNSVNSEFGYGNDMASYLGVYYGKNGQEFRFPVSGNSIDMNGFYGTNKIAGGSTTIYSSTSFLIPVYNVITITAVGGQGGQSGSYGYSSCGSYIGPTPSGDGSSGGTTSFGGYSSSGGGGGGSGNAVSGVYGSAVAHTFTNPIQGGSGPTSGTYVTASIGGGGSGGGGGPNFYVLIIGSTNYGCANWNNAGGGNSGNSGYVTITWT
jgi:hypothetical protein